VIYEEHIEGGIIWWTRLPRIPVSVEDAKSLPQVGPVIFICDCEIYKGRDTMRKLIDIVIDKNKEDCTIAVWHNHKWKKMYIHRRDYGTLVHAK
jgi:hypothetical protein